MLNNFEPSIWELETIFRDRDIVIIGAGFTGLWCAISLREKFPQKNILVIERNAIPIGASSRNAGFACFGSLTEIIADSEKMGWEKTLSLLQMRYIGLQKIQNYFEPKEIDFDLCGGYEIINDEALLQKIDEVNFQLKSITNLDQTFKINQNKLSEFGFKKSKYLIENPLEGSLHPGKLLVKLIEKCRELKIEFLFGTDVLHVEENKEEINIQVSNNIAIKSEKVIFCTNAFSNSLIDNLEITPVRGQILVTEPIENLKLKGTFHFDDGYIYFRNLGNRILLGGARNQDFITENTVDFSTTDLLQNYLENFLKEVILPNQDFAISNRWSGIMAMGKEKTPLIEKLSERQFCAVRLSGMGVALAPKIGEIVADLI